MPRRKRLALTMYASLALGTTALVLALWACGVFRASDLATVDARFAVRGNRPAPDVVVVAIDPRTLTELGQFPFRRSYHARVIRRLIAAGARVVAYDVQFTERGPSVADDNALVRAVDAAPKIVLGTSEVGRDGATNVLGGNATLRAVGALAGSVNVPNDPGDIVRRVAYDESGLPSFPVAAARLDRGAAAAPRADFEGDRTAWIDFPGPPGTIRTVPFVDVERGRVDPRIFRGKIAVVGATAQSLKDVFPVATSSEQGMSGPEIQAAAIQTLLDGVPLRPAPRWLDGGLIVVLGVLGGAVTVRRGPRFAAIAGLAAAALFVVAAQVLFQQGVIVSVLYPLTALGLGFVGALGVAATVGAFERERVRDLFARFVPEAVVDDVLARADGALRLGGERKVVTVMFSDVRGFTTYADRHEPEQVLDVLNAYLAVMSDVIHDHGGTLVAYMGDGIMAVFGAPTAQVDHADRAVAAAREMTGPALDRVNLLLRARGDAPFAIGVGLHAGPVMAGNVGSERRMEYTTIGDTTNTASRLEGMTKGTPHAIFLSEAVRGMLTRPCDDLVHVDELAVRGKDAPVSVWSLA